MLQYNLDLIEIVAIVFAQFSGLSWQVVILSEWPMPKGFCYSLIVEYLVWKGFILSFYPCLKWFDNNKKAHNEK